VNSPRLYFKVAVAVFKKADSLTDQNSNVFWQKIPRAQMHLAATGGPMPRALFRRDRPGHESFMAVHFGVRGGKTKIQKHE